jgi:hypothetical protein
LRQTLHKFGYQLVGPFHRGSRFVDKAGLYILPLGSKILIQFTAEERWLLLLRSLGYGFDFDEIFLLGFSRAGDIGSAQFAIPEIV